MINWESPGCGHSTRPLSLWSPKLERDTPPCQTQVPEEQQHCLGKGLEIVVPIDLVVVPHGDFPKHLGREIMRGKKEQILADENKTLHLRIKHYLRLHPHPLGLSHGAGHFIDSHRCAELCANCWQHGAVRNGLPSRSPYPGGGTEKQADRQPRLLRAGLTQRHRKHRTGSHIRGWGLGSERPPGE